MWLPHRVVTFKADNDILSGLQRNKHNRTCGIAALTLSGLPVNKGICRWIQRQIAWEILRWGIATSILLMMAKDKAWMSNF